MNLANYINDLLYRYDCVIIPDFGGFVTNRIGATFNTSNQTFNAPAKQLTFNNHLKHNDGLLANYIASAEQISFEKAAAAISLSVINWQNKLQRGSIELNNLGTFSLNEEQKIVFTPTTEVNYLTSSFGLSSVATSAVKRHNTTVKPLHENNQKALPSFIKYAATAAILLTLGIAGYNGYQQNKQKETFAKQEKILEKKLQSATFVIQNPLPTLQLNVSKKNAKPFHVVAGAFQYPENAAKKIQQLKKQGFNAKIIGVNKWGLTQVCFDSFAEKNDAINSLNKIKRTVSEDAWLLVKNIK